MASSRFSASSNSPAMYVLLGVYLLCLLCPHGNCAGETAASTGSPGNVTEGVSDAGKQTVGTGKATVEAVTETGEQTVGPGKVTADTASETRGVTVGSGSATTGGAPVRYPNPWQDAAVCRRTGSERSWICDADGVLAVEHADQLDALLAGLNANASCVCNCSGNATSEVVEGYALGVAVVRSLPGDDLSSSNRTYQLEQFSDSVRQDWFADRICNDSALILAHYMYNCSKMHISLSDDLADLLPEGTLSSLYEAAQPSLDTGELAPALAATVRKLAAALEKAIHAQPPPNNLVWGILGVITISSILLFHYWIKY